MSNRPSRPRAATETKASAPEPTRSERLRVALTGAAAAAALSILLIGATTAMGGSGGVGSGGSSRSDGGDRYSRMWDDFSRKDRRWAHRTSNCESGGDPKIHSSGGTYHGAFQYLKSTWQSAPKSPGGDPHTYRWKTQAVVSVLLKHRDGARNHWPNCG
jgi:Transglycosylase-like domain